MAKYSIGEGDNYHIIRKNNAVFIRYTKNNTIFERRLNGKLEEAVVVGYGDEMIPVYLGREFKRVKNETYLI